MNPNFKPTLAEDIPDNFPLEPGYVSRKLDGMRLALFNGSVLTRNLKEVPNVHIRKMLSHPDLQGLDGEVLCGDPTVQGTFNATVSACKRVKGEPEFTFNVFDWIDPNMSFEERYPAYFRRVQELQERFPFLRIVGQYCVGSMAELLQYEEQYLSLGYEGIMYRKTGSLYKFNRSTLKDGVLLRRKPFIDIDAMITGTYEQMQNTNEAYINELGRTQRSSAAEGKVGKGTLGGFNMVTVEQHGWPEGKEFDCGGGCDGSLTDDERARYWGIRDTLPGQLAVVRVMKYGSVDGVPRFPAFKGLQIKANLS
jgi:DNA ligase-1